DVVDGPPLDLAPPRQLASGTPDFVGVSSDGSFVAVARTSVHRIEVYDVSGNAVLGDAMADAFAPPIVAGSNIYYIHRSSLKTWRPGQAAPRTLNAGALTCGPSVAPDGEHVAFGEEGPGFGGGAGSTSVRFG